MTAGRRSTILRRSGRGNEGIIKSFILIILALIIAGFAVWLWTEVKNPNQKIKRSLLLSKILQETGQKKEKDVLTVQLFFASKANFSLAVEEREIKVESSTPQQEVCRVISELIKGPAHDDLSGTIPIGTKLRSFYLDKSGVGYADFSKEMIKNHQGGAWGELLTIYSVVNTVTKNFPQVHQIKLLIDGLEVETLKGHLDIGRAFSFNESLARTPNPEQQ
jgi:germination protein M